MPKRLLAVLLFALAAVAVWRLAPHAPAPPTVPANVAAPTPPPEPPATHVGSPACAGCHARETMAWSDSHHALAMQHANENTVLGDFSGVKFRYAGITSTFFRRNGAFFVHTDGPDGALRDYRIAYTFGVTPLQQYLIELPGGRLQALSIAWDARVKARGGQRWFHLYPDERITHTDELHWTRRTQNWNHMCAECHSTALDKNYDAAEGVYRTRWKEINVACEACHGPGSRHVAWANGKRPGVDDGKGLTLDLDERHAVRWNVDEKTGKPVRSTPLQTRKELDVCAHCHARRGQLFDDDHPGAPLLDIHLPALLNDGLYHADGQINGEVYEYGSFLQSRMYQAGVTCSDCHEPHSLKTRAPGNALCTQCHAAPRYDTQAHHFHKAGSDGSNCVDCHMPAKTYMGVDPRRDHSFRVPRPEQSARLGTPNACTGCHADRPPAWAAARLRQWYGHAPRGLQDYAETLHAARGGQADAGARLIALAQAHEQPAIARATAAQALGRYPDEAAFDALSTALDDADPLIRLGALDALRDWPPPQRWPLALPLLDDPLRVIRAQAASLVADAPIEQLPANYHTALDKATQEYLAAQQTSADQPESQVNLGNFHALRRDAASAEAAYRRAIALDPDWAPAYANLADLFRQLGRDAEGEQVLRDGLARQPRVAALHHSLGLLEVRRKNLPAALAALKQAVALAPDDARFSYVYAVALDGAGKKDEARRVTGTALKRNPDDPALRQLREELK